MSDHQPQSYTIFCVILGETTPFPVKIASNETVGHLKDAIKGKRPNRFASVDASDLTLYHVEIPDIEDMAELVEQKLWEHPAKLRPTEELAAVFGDGLKGRTVHILVQPPQTKRADGVGQKLGLPGKDTEQDDQVLAPAMHRMESPPLAAIIGSIARRVSTVDALYQRLNRYRLVMVRGTPASGKTTLAQLLAQYIPTQEPGAEPILIGTWPCDGTSWLAKLTGLNYKFGARNIIIIDEAQLTYWDTLFWNNVLKPLDESSGDRVILFASYGSPSDRITVEGTPLVIPDRNRVSLRPVDHGDLVAPAGLFLTADEFADMVKRRHPEGCFKDDFLEYVFHVTAGHTGSVKDLLRIVSADESFRRVKHDSVEYSLEIFQKEFSMDKLYRGLNTGSVFKRGLPASRDLQRPCVAKVFRKALQNNYVTEKMLDSPQDREALNECYKSGWLHATANEEEFQYIFTTLLHRWYIDYYLGTNIRDCTPLMGDQNILEFAIKVIRGFSPEHLSSPRKIGASYVQRPPEAAYQDEFYRCCHQYSNGSLVAFPEFGDGEGKVDFYIPLKGWGVELLRNGDRLDNHSSRFIGSGAYAKMQLDDYIILDFRTKRPQKEHPRMLKLYHVLFTDKNYKHVEILQGSSLEMLEKFDLLNPL